MADYDILYIKRCTHSEAAKSTKYGSHGRRLITDKLIDISRRVATVGIAHVDNGASITPGLANLASMKACRLQIVLTNSQTGIVYEVWGQAGLIRAECLTSSTTQHISKDKYLCGTNSEESTFEIASSLRSSRFAVIPVTCIHNVEDEFHVKLGATLKFRWSYLTPIYSDKTFVADFEKAGYTPSPGDSIVLHPNDSIEERITWKYHDVTTAKKIDNVESPLTGAKLSFQKLMRVDFDFQVGQKIGMAVYRKYDLTAVDAGMPYNCILADELRQIFGEKDCVNVYTGQITYVSPGKKAFEHNINAFQGCSGAVIFLLDVDQEGHGVIESDYGKAIAIHVGGRMLADGTIANFGFKIL